MDFSHNIHNSCRSIYSIRIHGQRAASALFCNFDTAAGADKLSNTQIASEKGRQDKKRQRACKTEEKNGRVSCSCHRDPDYQPGNILHGRNPEFPGDRKSVV